ncbi:MFS transporter [candidate division KSB1 bacterium]|nr:MFS transporter [candidate division KSB1 bacterium]
MHSTTLKKTANELSPLYRWTVLFFISLAMFGNYYIYDSISPLADVLREQLNFTNSNIGLLNAIYSFPNIIMVLIGGIIIDRIGTKKASFIFSFLCMTGALVTTLEGNIITMATGRLIFGLGAESLIVAITTVIAKWFKGKELSFAFGLNLTIARLGSFAALNSPTLAKSLYSYWKYPLLLALGAGIISLLAVIVYFSFETYSEKRYNLTSSEVVDKINIRDIFVMSSSFWYITLLCVTFYSAIFPFQTFAVKFFIEHHGLSREMAGFTSSLITFAAMIGTPLFGLFIDLVGKRASLMMLGSVLLIPVYLLLIYTPLHPIVPMVFMGVAFSLIPAAMWPSVALIVKEQQLGTAYGLMTMIQNIGLFGFNLLIGFANDISGGYRAGMWLFSTLGFAGLFFAFMLKRADRLSGNGQLEKSKII